MEVKHDAAPKGTDSLPFGERRTNEAGAPPMFPKGAAIIHPDGTQEYMPPEACGTVWVRREEDKPVRDKLAASRPMGRFHQKLDATHFANRLADYLIERHNAATEQAECAEYLLQQMTAAVMNGAVVHALIPSQPSVHAVAVITGTDRAQREGCAGLRMFDESESSRNYTLDHFHEFMEYARLHLLVDQARGYLRDWQPIIQVILHGQDHGPVFRDHANLERFRQLWHDCCGYSWGMAEEWLMSGLKFSDIYSSIPDNFTV